ncbi:hypothetical protein C810_00250 [Lachnospiraceae bacterium A2]|jgi:Acetyltransferase (isoleucine patch superfamily)|nr:hypothetical protein C810_00250 [Lachnospiraceae bacterium A2]
MLLDKKGQEVFISRKASIYGAENIRIGNHVRIDEPGVSLGEGSAVGAMSLVKESVEPWTVAAGIPAKPIKPRGKRILELEKEFMAEEVCRVSCTVSDP